jgi:glycosyltransferase involved in cell wall biosynthesis
MKILSLTAGAAGMYCGSCLRDNALAAELIARGHDVILQPVYTPTRTDEPNVSAPTVVFGGISVYLQQKSALFRSLPRLVDRLWDAPRVIDALARRSASTDPRHLGDLTISMLRGEGGHLRREFDKLAAWTSRTDPPDVINLPNSLLIALAAPLRQQFNRPVCCTLQGEELFLNGLLPRFREEALALIRAQVRSVDRFIAVSDSCAAYMGQLLGIPNGKMSVVPLGIRMDGYRRPQHGDGSFRIGYFARVAPEKGLHVLADAYIAFRRLVGDQAAEMRLEAAGYLSPSSRPYLEDVRARLRRAGLDGEFTYRGELDREGKIAFLSTLDLLSVPATYDEPKGMFLLEAMASGVPVVQPRRGAFTEIVERTGGGVLVEPEDTDRLAAAFATLWQDRAQRAALANRAYAGVRVHYSVSESTTRLLQVYDDVVGQARDSGERQAVVARLAANRS